MNEKTARVVLGMIMKDPKNFMTAFALGIKSEMFLENRRIIFDEITKCELMGQDFNEAVMVQFFKDAVRQEVFACIEAAPNTQSFSYWAKEHVKEHWKQKWGLRLNNLAKRIYTTKEFTPIEPLLREAEDVVGEMTASFELERTKDFNKVIDDYEQDLEKRIEEFERGCSVGIPTGLTKLNESIIGFQKAKFYIVAARTSIGKTTIAVNFMLSALKQNKNVIFFSVEMTENEILEKMLSLHTGIHDFDLTKGNVKKYTNKISESLLTFRKMPGFISSTFGNSIQTIEAEAKFLHQKNKLDFIIVDYAQQIIVENTKIQNRAYELDAIARRLKNLAKNYKVPVLTLSQINREADKEDKDGKIRPKLGQLKDSDSLALAADCVMLLWCDKNDYWIEVAKARKGCKKNTFKIKANLDVNCFSDHDDKSDYQ